MSRTFIRTDTPLTEIISDYTFNGIFHDDQFETFDVPSTKIDEAIDDIKNRLNVKLKTGKVSTVLLGQLARHKLNIYEKFGNEIHSYHFQTILDIIESVENGLKVNMRPFNRDLLAGLQHVHHNSSTFASQNLTNYWRSKVSKNNEVDFQNKLLEDIFNKLDPGLSDEATSKRALTVLLTQLLMESKFRKSKKQTGEWVVYGRKDGVNYYLCLATHKEAEEFTDKVIFDRLTPCFNEFPEVMEVITNRP
jgi:hypothetical protein